MQDMALELYETKKKEQPLLVSPTKKEKKEKRKTYNWKENATIDREKITDDLGRDIAFKKPDGDRIPNPFFKKFGGTENNVENE
jgi:hypothetical protein